MTETELTKTRADAEPVFGRGWGWITAPIYRIIKLLTVDLPSPAGLWFLAALWVATKNTNAWAIAHLGMAAVYWAARRYFGPLVEAICDRIRSKQ